MKLTISLLMVATLLGACSSNRKPELSREEITQVMKSQKAEGVLKDMLTAIDQREWKDFEKVFATQTVVHLNEPLILTPERVTKWLRPTYEFYDSTRHELDDFKLEEKDERVLGTAKVKSHLWKNDGLVSDVATITGKYEVEFINEGESLKIMRMAFLHDEIEGDKKILQDVKKSVQVVPPYQVQIVNFPSRNMKSIRGWLYIPRGDVRDVIIMSPNIASIKEQGTCEYARKLANQGFGALVFDFVNFGESEGNVRNLEDPGQKIDDIRGAVDFVANRKDLAGAKITLASFGGSAGYIGAEAVKDPRVDRLVMISPWMPNIDLFQSREFDARGKLKASREANHQYQQDGVLTYVPVASHTDNFAIMPAGSPDDLDYYTNPKRGNIPQWQNRFATMGWGHFINFDGMSAASRIRVPTLIIRSSENPYPEGVKDFISRMKIKPIENVLDVDPYDFYDHEETVDRSVTIIEEFLNPASAGPGVTKL